MGFIRLLFIFLRVRVAVRARKRGCVLLAVRIVQEDVCSKKCGDERRGSHSPCTCNQWTLSTDKCHIQPHVSRAVKLVYITFDRNIDNTFIDNKNQFNLITLSLSKSCLFRQQTQVQTLTPF